jgi:hypothetical protein
MPGDCLVRLTPNWCQGNLDTVSRHTERGEPEAYLAFLRRVTRAAARQIGEADVMQLAALVAIREDLDNVIHQAVQQIHANGATWAEIGEATGTSRQAAHQKWAGALPHENGRGWPGYVCGSNVPGTASVGPSQRSRSWAGAARFACR